MIRHLIWDVDGTLIDTYSSISRAMQETMEVFGYHADLAEVDVLCKVSFGHCVERMAEAYDLDAEVLNASFVERLARVPVTDQRPFPGAESVCQLAESLGGANYILTHRDRESLHALLAGNDLEHWFVDVVAGDDGYPRKPDPSGLNALLERNRVPQAEALMIGDRNLDVQAAQGAGIRACFYGNNPLTTPAAYVVSDYAELLAIILSESDATDASQ